MNQRAATGDRELTVRQSSNHDVLCGDTRTVFVVGDHTETVLGVLPQAGQSVRLTVDVNVLKGVGGHYVTGMVFHSYVKNQNSQHKHVRTSVKTMKILVS